MLPWQGHTMAPFSTLSTGQPWWVQLMPNALNWPSAGCTTTTFCSVKILPPPTGISAVVVSPPAASGALDEAAPDSGDAVVVSLPPQAASASVSPPAPTPANTVLRLFRSSPMRHSQPHPGEKRMKGVLGESDLALGHTDLFLRQRFAGGTLYDRAVLDTELAAVTRAVDHPVGDAGDRAALVGAGGAEGAEVALRRLGDDHVLALENLPLADLAGVGERLRLLLLLFGRGLLLLGVRVLRQILGVRGVRGRISQRRAVAGAGAEHRGQTGPARSQHHRTARRFGHVRPPRFGFHSRYVRHLPPGSAWSAPVL